MITTLPPASGISRTPIQVERNFTLILARNPQIMDFLNTLCSALAQVEPMVQNGAFFIALDQVPIYANNAAAVAGGLMPGNLYRTGANPDPVCIVK